MHNWYPFLEGYSPQFVQWIATEFVPNAKTILDPFAGSGTTPLTIASMGKQAYYCELNPVLQFVTEAKRIASRLKDREKELVVDVLQGVLNRLDSLLTDRSQDIQLLNAYKNVFEESIFFPKTTFETILRARSLIDHIACKEPLAAKFLTVAALSSLIPSSNLIRRGDIRYKTEDESKKFRTDFVQSVKEYLEVIIKDLGLIESFEIEPVLVCENAAELNKIPKLDIDAIITSPPYLNGTNYFRNTKIELWFLRCLNSKKDLSSFRFKAVTAGINDVTFRRLYTEEEPDVMRIVSQMEATAYDRRIPQMVMYYFADMKAVFRSIKKHIKENTTLAIDIGDSSYCGVHVKTDEILVNILTNEGFKLENDITLRKRMSRDGSTLRQSLLLFKYEKRPFAGKVLYSKPGWSIRWKEFTAGLPHQKGDFAKRNWGNPLHSLCSYQGKMKPSLAFHLVKTFASKGEYLLDPFAGVGTIPFEAAQNGVKSVAFEISPAAFSITRAKLGIADFGECCRHVKKLESYIDKNDILQEEVQKANEIHFNGSIKAYFEPKTLKEILLARRYFLEKPATTCSESLVFSSLLHILHGNRPYALSRRSHPITPFAPTGAAEYKNLIQHVLEKIQRSLGVERAKGFVEGECLLQDATTWWNQEIDNLDAIITSPPFYDSTRFYLANWMRLWFSGWEASDFRTKPLAFVDQRQKLSFNVYENVFRQARERLKSSGVMVLHLGKSKKCDMASELSKIAKRWFRSAEVFSEDVDHCESHGIRDKGTVTTHQYLVLH